MWKLKALDAVLSALAATGTVPGEYLPHPLSGDWANHMECHKEAGLIKLVRLGSHSELFGK